MSEFIIYGNKKLSGVLTTNTSKNGALAVIIASLLNSKATILDGVPQIEEINRLIEIMVSIGVKIKWLSAHTLKIIPPKKFNLKNIDINSAQKTRIIILFVSVLAHRFKKFSLPASGGCKLGKRSINPHLFALEPFGIKINMENNKYLITVNNLKPVEKIVLYESGDTVTENAIMTASLIPGKTVIKYASANYQVQELCYFLQKSGIKIKGIGTTTLEIYGCKILNHKVEYSLSEDPIESMLFISLAATTNSQLTIKRCPIDFLELELLKLEKMGFKYKIIKSYLAKNNKTNLVDIKTFKSKLMASSEKIDARPYPGINIDNLPFFVPIAIQAKGKTLIHDWMYENRAIYYQELSKLGAKITQLDPHRVYIEGPTKLHQAVIDAPPALRPSAIILVAMLASSGKSVLKNIYGIERGYENLAKRLRLIGADIKRID